MRLFRRCSFVLVAVVTGHVVSGCASHPAPSVRELFDGIQVGMACAEVEAVLGPPVLRHATVVPPRVGDDVAWYLPPPEIDPIESPMGPGTICIIYSVDGRVVSKSLNPQWREGKKLLASPPEWR